MPRFYGDTVVSSRQGTARHDDVCSHVEMSGKRLDGAIGVAIEHRIPNCLVFIVFVALPVGDHGSQISIAQRLFLQLRAIVEQEARVAGGD